MLFYVLLLFFTILIIRLKNALPLRTDDPSPQIQKHINQNQFSYIGENSVSIKCGSRDYYVDHNLLLWYIERYVGVIRLDKDVY